MRMIVLFSLLLTVLLEGITCVLRFGFQLESSHDTASSIGVLTHGIRIHHGYAGALMLLAAFLCRKWQPVIVRWAVVVGVALVLSDLVHHFAVLWPAVGSPEFDLVYPASGE